MRKLQIDSLYVSITNNVWRITNNSETLIQVPPTPHISITTEFILSSNFPATSPRAVRSWCAWLRTPRRYATASRVPSPGCEPAGRTLAWACPLLRLLHLQPESWEFTSSRTVVPSVSAMPGFARATSDSSTTPSDNHYSIMSIGSMTAHCRHADDATHFM